MIRPIFCIPFLTFTVCLLLTQIAFAQCTSVIPGLPDIPSVPCSEPFTPNTPSTPTDGPNLAGSPNEPKHVNNACDGDFMNQIYARSFLEANREIMIGELLVNKPDSVLEYTCFDGIVKATAETAGLIFTESNLWLGTASGAYSTVPNPGGPDIILNVYMGDLRLDTSLNLLVMRSLDSFVDATSPVTGSFVETFLNGRGLTNNVAASVGAASYGCSNMDAVYDLAKCDNIDVNTFFMRFSDMVGTDPRDTLPASLQCSATDSNPIVTAAIDVANNTDGTYVSKDPFEVYTEMVYESTCTDPIPTGIMWAEQETFTYGPTGSITSATRREFEEYICANPGCYYEPTASGGFGACRETP
ncbi:MAG: hypothetical protein AB8B83_06450 [Bdellovibrionales bacterium]